MPKQSAGILAYRKSSGHLEVLLVHPGGPFSAHKDEGAWSIPKGEFSGDEDPLEVAKREFHEEIGTPIDGQFTPLEPVKQRSGKVVYSWLVEADLDVREIQSNTFSMEWPPKSGKMQDFPEVDRAEWFDVETAQHKMISGQQDLLRQLTELIE